MACSITHAGERSIRAASCSSLAARLSPMRTDVTLDTWRLPACDRMHPDRLILRVLPRFGLPSGRTGNRPVRGVVTATLDPKSLSGRFSLQSLDAPATHPLRVLGEPRFVLYLASAFASGVSSSMLQTGLLWHVYKVSGSA